MKAALPFLFLILSIGLYAQQDPLQAQYYNYPMLVNPAFAGSFDRLFVGAAYRTQWNGLEGAPASFYFNTHLALANNKVGAGIIMTQDRVGEFKTTQYGGAFSYRIGWEENASLTFGIQMGFVRYSSDLEGVRTLNPDSRFTPFSETMFNTGAGLLLKGEQYRIGLSVPQLLPNTIQQDGENVQIYSQNYYGYGSYIFFLSERILFKPSTLLRITKETPVSMDVNLNLTLDSNYTAGLFTRNLNTYGVLLQLVQRSLRFSYVFELPGKGTSLNFNTHEVGVALSLAVLKFHDNLNTGF